MINDLLLAQKKLNGIREVVTSKTIELLDIAAELDGIPEIDSWWYGHGERTSFGYDDVVYANVGGVEFSTEYDVITAFFIKNEYGNLYHTIPADLYNCDIESAKNMIIELRNKNIEKLNKEKSKKQKEASDMAAELEAVKSKLTPEELSILYRTR